MEESTGSLEENQECSSEVGNSTGDDHTIILPEDILSYILSFLTMRDAVKVRLLSSRWRYICAATFDLHFDLFTLFGIDCGSIYCDKKRNDLWEGRSLFVRAVDQVLQFHKGEKLDSFKVCYSLGNESACYIDGWISFAVGKHTQKLHLDFSLAPASCELYNFPCHLLPQSEASELKYLSLEACVLRPHSNFTKCFNSLTKLELNRMALNQSDLDDILSACINLEFVRLEHCKLPGIPSICGGLKLRWLIVENCGGIKFEVSCINLTTFEFIGIGSTFKFSGVPYLKNVFLHQSRWSNRFLTAPAEDLPPLRNLTQVLLVQQRLPRPLSPTACQHVIKLELMVFLMKDFSLLSIIYILNVFPRLQKFHLAMQCWSGTSEVKWEYSEQLYYHLKRVEISGFVDRCNSLELAIYLLRSAVGLEHMIINSRKRRYYGGGKWSHSKHRTMSRSEKRRIREVLSRENVNQDLQVRVI